MRNRKKGGGDGDGSTSDPLAALKAQRTPPFLDSPFAYLPKQAYPFAADEVRELVASTGLYYRSELDDLANIMVPADAELAKVLLEAPQFPHLMVVDKSSKDKQTFVGSGRLLHYAVARGMRELVGAYIAKKGDLNAKSYPKLATDELERAGATGLHDACITPAAVAIWMRQHGILEDLLAADADPNTAGTVWRGTIKEGCDRVPSIVREVWGDRIDRNDIEPAAVGAHRTTVWYAARVGDAESVDIVAKHARRLGIKISCTQADLDAAKKRGDKRIAERLQASLDDGSFTPAETPQTDAGGQMTRNIRSMQRRVIAVSALFAVVFFSYLAWCIYQWVQRETLKGRWA